MSKEGAGLIGVLAIAAIFGAISYSIQSHIEKTEINVTSKERLLSVTNDGKGNTSSTYRNFVYTDNETYVVKDSVWNGHFTSATVYARVKIGSRCKVTLAGYRVGFLSMFQNIIEVECQP